MTENHKRLAAPILLSAAIGMDGFGGMWRTRESSQARRNDPDRQKTPADLAAIEAARAKRARKQARRPTSQNTEVTGAKPPV